MSVTEEETREGFYLSEEGEWVPDGWTVARLTELTVNGNISYGVVQPGSDSPNGVPMLRVNNLTSGSVDFSDVMMISKPIENKHRKTRLEQGDVLLSLVGTTGLTLIVPEKLKGWNVARAIAVIRPKPGIDPRWIKYSIESGASNHYLNGRANTTVQKTLNLGDVKTLPVLLPKSEELASIVSLVDCLDDKIELLREQNETLEALAQTLFKHWFIDFNFPDENGKPYKDSGGKMIASELGEIPEEWTVGKLSEVVTVKYGKDRKSLEAGQYPCYGSGGVMRSVERALCKSESVLIPRKGTLSNLMYVREPFWSVDTMFFTEFKKANFVKYFFLLMDRVNLEEMNVGSAVPSMTTAVLNEMQLLYPDDQSLEEFESLCESFYAKVQSNTDQIQTLTQLRDTLLPKLMKGEIRVAVES